jgi:hypothetical protein
VIGCERIPEVHLRGAANCLTAEHRIRAVVAAYGLAGCRQISPRRKQHGAGGQRGASITQRNQGGQRKTAAGRITRNHDGLRQRPAAYELPVRGQRIFQRGWEAVFGC